MEPQMSGMLGGGASVCSSFRSRLSIVFSIVRILRRTVLVSARFHRSNSLRYLDQRHTLRLLRCRVRQELQFKSGGCKLRPDCFVCHRGWYAGRMDCDRKSSSMKVQVHDLLRVDPGSLSTDGTPSWLG